MVFRFFLHAALVGNSKGSCGIRAKLRPVYHTSVISTNHDILTRIAFEHVVESSCEFISQFPISETIPLQHSNWDTLSISINSTECEEHSTHEKFKSSNCIQPSPAGLELVFETLHQRNSLIATWNKLDITNKTTIFNILPAQSYISQYDNIKSFLTIFKVLKIQHVLEKCSNGNLTAFENKILYYSKQIQNLRHYYTYIYKVFSI